jgi:signal peptidase I
MGDPRPTPPNGAESNEPVETQLGGTPDRDKGGRPADEGAHEEARPEDGAPADQEALPEPSEQTTSSGPRWKDSPDPRESGDWREPTESEPERRKRRSRPWYAEVAVLVLVAFVLALLIKTFVIQAFYIPSASMHPTLVENDRVLVNRFVYRIHEPHRGDVIVFQNPHPRKGHQNPVSAFVHWLGQGLGIAQGGRNKDFIKRVIGLPGDTVEIHQGVVFVNGARLQEPYLSPIKDRGSYGPYLVPAGCLFVLGDNRTDSDDSRGSLGYVPISKVIGRAFVIVWPPSRWGGIHPVDYGTIPPPSATPPSPSPTPSSTGP